MSIDLRANDIYGRTQFDWYYVFDFTGFVAFNTSYLGGTISDYPLTNLFNSLSEYVVKAQIYPFSLDNFFTLTSTSHIFIGKTSTTQNAYYTTMYGSGQGAPVKFWFTINLIRNFNNFLDFSPYTSVKLYVPFFELIELPLEKCYGETINVYLSIDASSGKSTLWLYRASDGMLVTSSSTRLSFELALGRTNAEEKERNNVLQLISGLGSAVGIAIGVNSGNPLITTASVGLLTKNVTTAINNNVDHLTSYKGNADSRDTMVCDKNIYLIISRPQNVVVPSRSLKGGVCRKNLSLSNVTGYTEIGEIHFNSFGYDIYDNEVTELTDLLRSGVIL